ncbi:arabinosyltransferase domain-containing protein [Pseudonocardia phyllosphaerae]|uniref:arabinosyltransferase domain-containing protein n=1 Tax=Pseudonocardia phyllosphaerae TaxID=3390502 RepID=UPI00397DD7FF
MSTRAAPARGALLLLLAGLTCVLGAAAALAPVNADDPVLTWPQAGRAPESTTVPLAPYRPLELTATVPCATVAGVAAAGGGDVLRTMPAGVNAGTAPSLAVTASGPDLTVRSGSETLYAGPAGQGCTWTFTAGTSGTTLSRDGAPVAERPALAPPQVAELATDATGPAAAGLGVQLHTDARYESSPSALKIVLLVAHLLALAATLAVAVRTWTGTRPPFAARLRPTVADAVVVVVSIAWAFLGPINIDDSWYALMARQGAATGAVGNAIYQFNVSEAPFTTSQYLLQFWGQLGDALGLPGWGLLWLRVVPVALGFGTWVLLRATLAALTGRAGTRAWPAAALAVGHLLWFCAYGISLRPEPAGTAATAGVLLLVALALRTGSVGLLAPAVAVAVAGVTTAPTALVAAAPLLLALPMVGRHLAAAGWPTRVTTALVAAAAASVIVPLGMWDATLADVRESFAVHRWYYYQYSWFSEIEHYANLFGPDEQGTWGRRLPVALALALLVTGLVALGRRRGSGGPTGDALAFAWATTGLGLAAVAVSPTKWVNHFGAVAAPAALLVAVALIHGPLPRRVPGRVVAIGTAVLVVAASVAFAGPNLWRPLSDWGQAFGSHTQFDSPILVNRLAPHVGPLYLRNPLVWVAVALVAFWWLRRRRRAGHASGPGPERAVLAVAGAGGVALMLLLFAAAPVAQAPGASVASMNAAALAGRPCGLADAVSVQVPQPAAPPAGPARLTGDAREGTPPDRSPAPDGGTTWHTQVGAAAGTGSVTTGWYPVPPGTTTVLVPATGDVRPEQSVAVEAGTGPVGAPSATVRVAATLPEDKQADWTTVAADLSGQQLPGPVTQVRMIAEDRASGADTWFAVGAPQPTRAERAGQLIGDAPAFADQVTATLWPCQNQAIARHGIVDAPQWRMRTGDDMEGATGDNAWFAANGGVFTGIGRTARFEELPSRLDPAGGRAMYPWGHVDRVVYEHPPGRYDLRVGTERRWGWTKLPTIAFRDYTGRDYLG